MLDRFIGLARSLAIYHGIPLRQRRLRRLYAQFASPGDLVFDLGAHAGNRTRALASIGCRVVAVEPQPDFARLLRAWFARSSRVAVVQAAVCNYNGKTSLAISERTPTVTTVDASWREARSREAGFAGVRWNRTLDVEAVTVDALIARFGMPTFIKMDVEGSESHVLEGLTLAVPALSFEYLPFALADIEPCLARLESLGEYEYNFSIGESYRLASGRWLTAAELAAAIRRPEAARRAGDAYARLVR